jgi:hypothetical protein
MNNIIYPNILIISHNSFSKEGMGKTLSSIFSKWPILKLSQLYFNSNEKPDYSLCNNYFQLTDPVIFKNIFITPSYHDISNFDNERLLRKPTFAINSTNFGFNFLLFRDLLWSININKYEGVFKWVEKTKPDIVFFVGGASAFSYKAALAIVKKFNLPLFLYFTDDYYINRRINNPLKCLQYFLNTKPIIKKSIALSKANFVIGELMAAEYSKIFNKEFFPVMNSIDFDLISKFHSINQKNQDIVLSYIGGLHFDRWKTLVELGILLRQIKKDRLINVTLKIYSTEKLNERQNVLLNQCPLIFNGSLDSDEVRKHQIESDILIHVEGFNREYRKATKYSVSTKIPEYLSSARCILAFGPSEIASIRLLSDNNLGVIITEKDSYEQKYNKLVDILINPKLRDSYGNNGYQYALKKFNTKYTEELMLKTFFKYI